MFDNYFIESMLGDKPIVLHLFDTVSKFKIFYLFIYLITLFEFKAGQEDYDRLRVLAYPNTVTYLNDFYLTLAKRAK